MPADPKRSSLSAYRPDGGEPGSHRARERGRQPTRAGRGVCARLGLVTPEHAERHTRGPPGETQPPSSCLDPGLGTRGTGLNTQGHTRATCCQPPSALRVCPPCSTPKPGLALPVGEQVASRTRPLPMVQPRARPRPGSACVSDPLSPARCRPPLEGLLGPLLGASVAPARPHEAESCRPLCSPQEGAGPASAIVSKVLPAAPQEGVRQGSGGAQLGAVGGAITCRQKAARRRAPLTDTERRLEEEEENGCGEETLRHPGGPGPPSAPGSETSAKLAPAVGPGLRGVARPWEAASPRHCPGLFWGLSDPGRRDPTLRAQEDVGGELTRPACPTPKTGHSRGREVS